MEYLFWKIDEQESQRVVKRVSGEGGGARQGGVVTGRIRVVTRGRWVVVRAIVASGRYITSWMVSQGGRCYD